MTVTEFSELRYGMFVHFGLFSMLARGEWVMNREQIHTISDVITGKKAAAGLPENKTLDSYRGKKISDKLDRRNVNFVSGATVSSNAILDLVNNARTFLQQSVQGVK